MMSVRYLLILNFENPASGRTSDEDNVKRLTWTLRSAVVSDLRVECLGYLSTDSALLMLNLQRSWRDDDELRASTDND